jgi:hypothetical protein
VAVAQFAAKSNAVTDRQKGIDGKPGKVYSAELRPLLAKSRSNPTQRLETPRHQYHLSFCFNRLAKHGSKGFIHPDMPRFPQLNVNKALS